MNSLQTAVFGIFLLAIAVNATQIIATVIAFLSGPKKD